MHLYVRSRTDPDRRWLAPHQSGVGTEPIDSRPVARAEQAELAFERVESPVEVVEVEGQALEFAMGLTTALGRLPFEEYATIRRPSDTSGPSAERPSTGQGSSTPECFRDRRHDVHGLEDAVVHCTGALVGLLDEDRHRQHVVEVVDRQSPAQGSRFEVDTVIRGDDDQRRLVEAERA